MSRFMRLKCRDSQSRRDTVLVIYRCQHRQPLELMMNTASVTWGNLKDEWKYNVPVKCNRPLLTQTRVKESQYKESSQLPRLLLLCWIGRKERQHEVQPTEDIFLYNSPECSYFLLKIDNYTDSLTSTFMFVWLETLMTDFLDVEYVLVSIVSCFYSHRVLFCM